MPPDERADDGTARDNATVMACQNLRQGDVVDLHSLPVIGADSLWEIPCPLGVVIITQTCDLVQPGKPYAVVAPVVDLAPNESGLAKSGRMPQYIHLSGATNESYFLDLTRCATVTKSALGRHTRLYAGVDPYDGVAVSRFGAQIGRRFSRFAFPDEVQPWFRPLQEKVAKGYGKESPLGRLLRETVDLRIQSNNWNVSGMHLVIHVIVPSSLVPNPDDFDPDETSEELVNDLRPEGELIEDAGRIAARILTPSLEVRMSLSAADRFYLWNAFAEALAQLCQPKMALLEPSIRDAVASVTGQLSTDEEFSLYLFRRTESLDLEHLSPPVPFTEQQT